MSSSEDLRPPPDRFFGPLDRATKRPRIQSIQISSNPKRFLYRIKRVLIQILSGHVLELILTEILYGFLNVYKILRILRELNIVKFKKQSLSFQNVLSKL